MIYLDYAATNPFTKYPCSKYGQFLNPNANYAYREKKLLDECANRVKAAIGATSGKVVFGGTSSQLIENLIGAVNSAHDKDEYHVYCSCYEHDSFFRYLDNELLDLNEIDTVFDIYNERTQALIMWQAVNNITGEIFSTKQIGEFIHKYNGFYICDGTAQIGHTPIEPNLDDWCDFWCCSGHKAGTELGIGCCWISDRFNNWLGDFKLHGTPNLAGAMAIADATENACKNAKEHEARAYEIYRYMLNKFAANDIHGTVVNDVLTPDKSNANEPSHSVSAINAIMFDDINAIALQNYLASKEIYIGIGQSSCADIADRRVLCQGYNLSEQEADNTIRISFGENSSFDDIDELVKNICEYKEKFVR